MTTSLRVMAIIAGVAMPISAAQQVDPVACPLHAAHTQQASKPNAHASHSEMASRGSKAMGFDQSRASHHFRLLPTGGTIEIHTNTTDDETTRRQVAAHLEAIAGQFKRGDFTIPRETHGSLPDGVESMMRFKDEITYVFEPIAHGGRLGIRTANPRALQAVHAFLRYQIREHRTGDPTTVAR